MVQLKEWGALFPVSFRVSNEEIHPNFERNSKQLKTFKSKGYKPPQLEPLALIKPYQELLWTDASGYNCNLQLTKSLRGTQVNLSLILFA